MKEASAREQSEVSNFDKTSIFARDTVEASCKYMNYMDRQVKEMEGWRRNQDFRCAIMMYLKLTLSRHLGIYICNDSCTKAPIRTNVFVPIILCMQSYNVVVPLWRTQHYFPRLTTPRG